MEGRISHSSSNVLSDIFALMPNPLSAHQLRGFAFLIGITGLKQAESIPVKWNYNFPILIPQWSIDSIKLDPLSNLIDKQLALEHMNPPFLNGTGL